MQLISGLELKQYDTLSRTMFTDRAAQFGSRLGWDVSVNQQGEERDQYDLPSTMYLILDDEHGRHAGSMRLLPTIGKTMLSDHFDFLLPTDDLLNPLIWECSRFCISDASSRKQIALQLFGAGASVLEHYGLIGFVGVFDPFMERIYRRYGVTPEVLTEVTRKENGTIKLGIWHNDSSARDVLRQKVKHMAGTFESGITPERAEGNFFRRRCSAGKTRISGQPSQPKSVRR